MSAVKETLPVVPLLIPKEYFAHRLATNAEQCYLVHVAEQGLLQVVEQDTENVLDVIDLQDMIGAKLIIEPLTQKKTTSTNATAANQFRASNEPTSDTLQDTQGQAVLTIYSYPRQDLSKMSWFKWCGMSSSSPPPNPNYQRPSESDQQLFGRRQAHHRTFVLVPTEDLKQASTLVAHLQHLAQPQRTPQSNRKVLVLVNPTSGPKRNGPLVAETVVEPMLQQAGLDCTIVILSHANHALQLARGEVPIQETQPEQTLSDYSALVIVGGDGTVHQVLQGLYDPNKLHDASKEIAIGVVGCGTANGFVMSLLHQAGERYGLTESIMSICKGETIRADLSRYKTTNNVYTSFLTFTWAMVADIDIDSELLHFLGEIRFDIWGVLRILWLRRYRAKFSFLKPTKSAASSSSATMPALDEPVPSDWETIEDDFILFWVSHVSHASMSNYQSPNSRLDDGVFQVFLIRSGVSKFRLIQIMLGLQAGTHVNIPGVEFIECVAYRLEPLTTGSYNDIDGEVVEAGPVQAQVYPAAWQVFGKNKPI